MPICPRVLSPTLWATGVIGVSIGRLSRIQVRSTVSSGWLLISILMSSQLRTGTPATEVMRSPSCRPTSSAGVPSITAPTVLERRYSRP